MHSVRVSSQLLVSGLFIAVPTNAENFKFFPTLVLFHTKMDSARIVSPEDLIRLFSINACSICDHLSKKPDWFA